MDQCVQTRSLQTIHLESPLIKATDENTDHRPVRASWFHVCGKSGPRTRVDKVCDGGPARQGLLEEFRATESFASDGH